MACEHTQTTTLLWLYGEADDTHLEHIQGCAECQGVVADHADVAAALGPALPAVATVPRRSWRRGAWVAGAVLLVAAAWLLVVRAPAPGDPVVASDGDAVLMAADGPLAPYDPFDSELDALDRELDRLSDDLEML